MQSFIKLQKQILSLHLDVVEIEGNRYFCLRDLTHETFLFEENTELRIDAINDLLAVEEIIAEKHIRRLRVAIEHLLQMLIPFRFDNGLIWELYEFCNESNVILKIGANLDNANSVVVTSNFSQDLFNELLTRLKAVNILEDFVLNAANGKKMINVDSAKDDQSIDLIDTLTADQKQNNLLNIVYQKWSDHVYTKDSRTIGTREIKELLKPKLPEKPYLQDIIIEKYRHLVEGLRQMLKEDLVKSEVNTAYGPVVNSEGAWITDKAVGVALYNALLNTGFILKNKTVFAKALLNEYPTLENTSFIKNFSYKNEAYQSAFEVKLHTQKGEDIKNKDMVNSLVIKAP